MAKLSRSISAVMRLSFSSRANSMSRRSKSVPTPRLWYSSEISTAISAFPVRNSLLSLPPPKNVLPTHLRIIALSNDHHFAVVITMADAKQSFVGCPSIEASWS
jgi:hypothetical protein